MTRSASPLRCLLLVCLLLVSCVSIAAAQASSPAAGEWQGMLSVNGSSLHLALHITGSGDALQATLDSIDQNAFGIPVTTIAFKAPTLTFAVTTLQASYTGKLSADAARLTGTFTQGGASLPLDFERLSTNTPEQAEKPSDLIAGTWTGALTLPNGNLPIVFHFASAGGKLTATIDSPQQGATGIAVSSITRAGNTLHMVVGSIDATFDGSFSPDAQMLTGTWTQRGSSLPLKLARSAPAAPTL